MSAAVTAMLPVGRAVASGHDRSRYALQTALVLLAGMLVLLLPTFHQAMTWQFGDPDDMMRLQEVRDWLAGQSWFDVTQYRIAPPAGEAMHWSRLLDVPLAAVIVPLRPLIGTHAAELTACIVVPLLTFALIAIAVSLISREILIDRRLVLLATFLTALDIGTISVARPMRIDHHGWQALCGLVMVSMLMGCRSRWRSVVAGVFAAFWMHISIEGIVFTAGCAAWLGCIWIAGRERFRDALPLFLASTACASLCFFVLAHGLSMFGDTHCDAVSPVHVVVLALAGAISWCAVRFAPRGIVQRAAALGVAAVVAAVTYRLWAPQCAGGPFASLTPLTYRYWYLTLPEGLPLWRQPVVSACLWLAFPLVGLAGALLGMRTASPARSSIMIDYAAMLAIAIAIGVFVLRACGFANILALPGSLILMRALWLRVGRLRAMPVRAVASAVVILLAVPITPACIVLAVASAHPHAAPARDRHDDSCRDTRNIALLGRLPASLMMTTLDTSPELILQTHHRAIAAGYHRNVASMDEVVRFFIGDGDAAHRVMHADGARYVFVCADAGDAPNFARAAPSGMAARLLAGRPPLWLRPVDVPGFRGGRVYRRVD